MSKGVFIEGITVDMLRNACLEAVEELMNEGDMVDMEVKPNEWIPVGERLPSESGWYFVTVQGMERVSDMVWYYHESNEWNGVSETQKALAWMPLPEPYKGGDEA